ncbi:CBO0543 family protein [Brevibacillus fulvus]|uniref:Uncharacterized protein n=1 Tax=Brevibacillus fulvus TaxID=1125967 RepID=A0A938Y1U6_9BACL|nr:CBO0543 family protein [Brevibacillus fulvus]MBM7590451.1 hypothetical protein [Brevibacillus fulvus]
MMTASQTEALNQIHTLQERLTDTWLSYWFRYSHMGTWQYWTYVAMLIVPLLVLLLLLDRKKAFHFGFFGTNIHIWFSYLDNMGAAQSLWAYPYHIIPSQPGSFSLDASLVPVVFMLMYQWTVNQQKNYYIYSIGVCVFFAFVLKPVFVVVGLFQLLNGTNYFHLFVVYVIVALVSKWITTAFLYFQKGQATLHRARFNIPRIQYKKQRAD